MILVNGQPADHVDVTDRGLAYGDGLFETLAVRNGEPLHWERHMLRMAEGCRRLGLPEPDRRQLRAEAQQVLSSGTHSALKLMLTRGTGPRGYRPPARVHPTRIVMAVDSAVIPRDWRDTGLTVRMCHTRLGRNPQLAGIKHLNRLEQVLARGEWQDEYHEGIMLDTQDNVVEATMSNLFLIRDGRLLTPRLDECGVAGVTRARVLDAADSMGIPVDVIAITVDQLYTADGVFLTSTLMGLCPVRELDGRTIPLSPLIPTLQRALEAGTP